MEEWRERLRLKSATKKHKARNSRVRSSYPKKFANRFMRNKTNLGKRKFSHISKRQSKRNGMRGG